MILDILVSVFASVFCFVTGVFWRSKIFPFLQGLFYHGIIIEGKWHVSHDSLTCDKKGLDIVRNTTIEISQQAFRLTGKAYSVATIDGRDDIIEYEVKGEIKDRILQLTFHNKDKTRMAHSMFLLKIDGERHKMTGYRLFYGLKASKVKAIFCTIEK